MHDAGNDIAQSLAFFLPALFFSFFSSLLFFFFFLSLLFFSSSAAASASLLLLLLGLGSLFRRVKEIFSTFELLVHLRIDRQRREGSVHLLAARLRCLLCRLKGLGPLNCLAFELHQKNRTKHDNEGVAMIRPRTNGPNTTRENGPLNT